MIMFHHVMILILAKVINVSGETNEITDCVDTYVKLTELSPSELYLAYWFSVNQWQEDVTAQIYTSITMGDGNIYDNFIVLHPPYNPGGETEMDVAHVVYDLNGEYNTFTAVIGMETNNKCVGDNYDGIKYKFYLDGVLVYESQELIQDDYQNININVENGNKLEIEVDKLDTIWCDHATIANPVLKTCTLPPPTPINCEWELTYEHNLDGETIFGSVAKLIEDIHNGKDIRIVGKCYGDCTFVITQPSRVWTRPNGRVYIFADDTIFMGWFDNNDPFAEGNKIYKQVFDTSGRIESYTNVDGEPGRVISTGTSKYPAKWFTRC